MNIRIGCDNAPDVEELIALLPGNNKDIYEDDAEELLETIQEQGAMTPVCAWKELEVTAVGEQDLELDQVVLKCPYLARKVRLGDSVYAAVFTAGKELHQMLSDCDDVMQEYILGFLMSHILTVKTVDLVEELQRVTGLSRVEMLMAGIPEICSMDQQVQVGCMLADEFAEAGVTVKAGGNLNPTYSSTCFLLFGEEGVEIPADWKNQEQRKEFGNRLYEQAGHA